MISLTERSEVSEIGTETLDERSESSVIVESGLIRRIFNMDSFGDALCETCANYSYDDEDEAYYCDVQMDEDEFSHVMLSQRRVCPFYRNGDEYEVVKHQAF